MAPALITILIASAGTAVASFASWFFVWRHEKDTEAMEKRGLKDQAFWFSFSYLLPFLPSFVAILGSAKVGILPERFTSIGVDILAGTMGVLNTGLVLSTFSWMRRDKAKREEEIDGTGDVKLLPQVARIHLNWTMALTLAMAGLWWWIVFS